MKTLTGAILLGFLAGGCASLDRPMTTTGAELQALAVAPERFFELSWQSGRRHGEPIVSGSIMNRYGVTADRVQLLVEGLDEAGAVRTQSVAWLGGAVTPYSTVRFEVPAPGHFPDYRVSVFAFDWIETPGHGFRTF